MPRLVPHARGTLTQGTVLEPANRGQYLRCAETDTVVRFGMDRAIDHDLVTDVVTGEFVPWQEGDPFREVCRWSFEASYDNGNVWESLGGGATGPEHVRKPTLDPDATKPVLLKTQAWFPLRPQVGNTTRLVRWSIEAIEGLETEVEVESDASRPPRLPVTSSNSVALEDSASGSSSGSSSVTTANCNQSGANKAAFAFLAVAGSTSLTVTTGNIDNVAATLVTGSNVQTGGASSEQWAYYYVNPTGVHDADFTVSSTANDMFAALFSCSDVDQTTPYNNVGTDSNAYFPSTFNGTSATSATDERVLDSCAVTDYSAGQAWTGTPDTAAFPIDLSAGETIYRAGHEAGAATVTIGYDYDTSVSAATYVWLNVNQAAAAAGGPRNPLGHPLKGPFGGPIG